MPGDHLDGAEFIDMSLMGVGTNSLGYAHPDINKAVIDAVNAGSMSTLNCHEEVALAERLVCHASLGGYGEVCENRW